ncbi:NADH-ubiquinone oxidoreductase 29.9 kDa subunit [Fusarium oxysporum f. sp. albedinis]|nr:NADH-ubiquinone oxidoreductase 29.9 kDa subunit [Fusarium oxysporum f. sp. albedinis]
MQFQPMAGATDTEPLYEMSYRSQCTIGVRVGPWNVFPPQLRLFQDLRRTLPSFLVVLHRPETVWRSVDHGVCDGRMAPSSDERTNYGCLRDAPVPDEVLSQS